MASERDGVPPPIGVEHGGDGQIIRDVDGQPKVIFPDGSMYNCMGVGSKRTAYACAVDFYDELEASACGRDGKPTGTPLYSSLEDLMEARKCIDECGWVKLELTVVKDKEKP